MDPTQFFGLPSPGIADADALILPWPLEKTVSYGTGTKTGPAAIIAASPQIELFEEETLVDFQQSPKLHVLPAIAVDPAMPEDKLPEHLAATAKYISQFRDRFLLTLGGEHLLTYGVVTGLVADPAADLKDVTIVQIDAHADLADTLGGRRWSHGTVMRRLWERGCRLVQVGIRSLSRPEYELVQSGPRIETFFAHELAARWDELLQLLARLEGSVYLSFDVDGLDPSIVPSTGTPQPNGLSWRQAMEVVRAVINAPCDLLGADVVEFIASPNPPGCDIIAARLVTKILAYWTQRQQTMLETLIVLGIIAGAALAVAMYIGELVVIGWIVDFPAWLAERALPPAHVPLEFEYVGEITIVKLSDNIASARECRSVRQQLDRLIAEHHCDFIIDFSSIKKLNSGFRDVLIHVTRAARLEAEKQGRQCHDLNLPPGATFRTFSDRGAALAEMARHAGHGRVVLCAVPMGIRAVSV